MASFNHWFPIEMKKQTHTFVSSKVLEGMAESKARRDAANTAKGGHHRKSMLGLEEFETETMSNVLSSVEVQSPTSTFQQQADHGADKDGARMEAGLPTVYEYEGLSTNEGAQPQGRRSQVRGHNNQAMQLRVNFKGRKDKVEKTLAFY